MTQSKADRLAYVEQRAAEYEQQAETLRKEIALEHLQAKQADQAELMRAQSLLLTWRMTRNTTETARRHGCTRYQVEKALKLALADERANTHGSARQKFIRRGLTTHG